MMQARKYDLSFVIVCQRTAAISKSALSQCESYVVFKTVDETALAYLEGMAGPTTRKVLPLLGRYEALCFGPAFNSENPIIVSLDKPRLINRSRDAMEGRVGSPGAERQGEAGPGPAPQAPA
jgi:DNA helicase HerA-like ATPase